MEYIVMKSEEFAQFLQQLNEIKNELIELKQKKVLSEVWVDNQVVCQELKISKRLLQNYRTEGKLPYAQHQAKIWYKAADIHSFLEANYHKAFKK